MIIPILLFFVQCAFSLFLYMQSCEILLVYAFALLLIILVMNGLNDQEARRNRD